MAIKWAYRNENPLAALTESEIELRPYAECSEWRLLCDFAKVSAVFISF